MPEVTVQKTKDAAAETAPMLAEIARRLDAVRLRAHELFHRRGCEFGRPTDDWFAAERELFGFAPAEVVEKENGYQVEFTLAGFDPKDVQVTATPAEIIVRAAFQAEREVEKGKILWSELGSKDIYRRFELPSPIDTDKVTAALDKGILRIKAAKVLAKAEREKNVTIAVAA